jgi:very-short-patch-repair endonuclease
MTLPEGMLWKRLRGKQAGVKFRNQHPIGSYVVDFYCSSARLVVEVDGMAHDNAERVDRDQARDLFLTEQGYDVLRLAAADVLRDVTVLWRRSLRGRQPPPPAFGWFPSPFRGGM